MSERFEAALGGELLAMVRRGDAEEALARVSWPVEALAAMAPVPEAGRPYGRRLLWADERGEVLLMAWRPGARCAAHDHGGSAGFVVVLRGELVERRLALRGGALEVVGVRAARAPSILRVDRSDVHDSVARGPALSVHVYTPPIDGMRVFDPEGRRTITVGGDHGAWLPDAGAPQVIAVEPWRAEVILIAYTTKYREGGAGFERAALTLAREKRAARPDADVRCVRVESKRELVDAIAACSAIGELHFIGHSGMYGPMFGTRALPEQFSPEEWRMLPIPFGDGASAYFHCCRSARWFAPFFARTFGVPAHGYHWYTSFSARPDRFRVPRPGGGGPLYVVGAPGRTSHGLLGSLGKYSGLAAVEAMKRFEPAATGGAESYDRVAELYDRAYDDIRVRAREWDWLTRHLPETPRPRVLDIGCGNGSLLQQLAGRVELGRGVDVSARMIELARARNAGQEHLAFERIDGPRLPFADDSFDVVVSFLSFRYLDWDPILLEIARVLRPGGRLLIVDMVAKAVRWRELGHVAASKLRLVRQRRENPAFAGRLAELVAHPRWAEMLVYNPIRSEHEFRWYLESRFPGQKVERLDVGWHSRVLAFDSGPIASDYLPPQSYP